MVALWSDVVIRENEGLRTEHKRMPLPGAETGSAVDAGSEGERLRKMRNKNDRPWLRYRSRPWAVLRLCYCVIQME